MTTTLTQQQKNMLQEIMNDKYAKGPFSGMVYNAVISNPISIDKALIQALNVRLRLEELSNQ